MGRVCGCHVSGMHIGNNQEDNSEDGEGRIGGDF